MAAESPIFDESAQSELFERNKPEKKPIWDEEKLKELCDYSEQIQLILQTANTNEYQAALTYMKPPNVNFLKAVNYPAIGMVVGKFAGIKTALIKTLQGRDVAEYIQDAIDAYPNAVCVIGVGVCYAFNKDYKLADVLVSNRICDFANSKFNNGKIENRGSSIPLLRKLEKIFTLCPEQHTGIIVSGDRKAKVASGTFCCSTFLINDEDERDKFYEAIKDLKPIGGEMEGGELIRFDRQKKIEGVIVIKGVADYAMGKTKEWQFTAAMAALEYTESQLHESNWSRLFPEVSLTSPNGSTVLPPLTVSMTPNVSTSATPSSRVAADSDEDVTGSYTYQGYLSKLSAQARKYLDRQLDWADLQTISEVLVDWEKNLSRCIGLDEHEEYDIKNGKNHDNPFLQRREVLQKWKDKRMFNATYANLLHLFDSANHAAGANKFIEVLNQKDRN